MGQAGEQLTSLFSFHHRLSQLAVDQGRKKSKPVASQVRVSLVYNLCRIFFPLGVQPQVHATPGNEAMQQCQQHLFLDIPRQLECRERSEPDLAMIPALHSLQLCL